MRKTTVYDVAERAGVSTATVSFTFRRPDKVKPATRERVLKAARELDYVPSANARGLARGKTGALGLYSFDMLIERPQGSDLEDFATEDIFERPDVLVYPLYADEVQRGFEVECWHRGQTVLLGTAVSKRDNGSITDIAGRVDGLALFPNRGTDDLPLARLCRSIPVVRIGETDSELPSADVICDNEGGIAALVDHLVDVHGVTEMSFIGELTTYDMHRRFEAFQSRAAERGIAMGRPLLDDSVASSKEWLVNLCEAIDAEQLPRALVCGNDQTALAVIDLLRDAGVRVPQDVIVTGFDGILASASAPVTLTTVRQPLGAMGRLAAKLLDGQRGVPWDEPGVHRMPVKLVLGNSCGCV